MALQKKRKREWTLGRTHPDEPDKKESKEERAYWKLMEIVPNGPVYTALHRLDAAKAYIETGSFNEASALSTVPATTIRSWARSAVWWKQAVKELREEKNDKLDGKITRVMDKVLTALEERLEHGDSKLNREGELVRIPISFRDLSIAGLAILFDKRALMRGQATSRTEVISQEKRLSTLSEAFAKIAQERTVEGNCTIKGNHEEGRKLNGT